jgi:predicted amidohydrolase
MKQLPSGLLEDNIGIAVIQIESPFYHELSKGKYSLNKNILIWTVTDKRVKKIKDVVLSVVKSYSDLNIIVLPEYSVPDECCDFLREIAEKHRVIIIGGSHYSIEKFKNLCPVFIPGQETIYIVKDRISPYESEIYFDKSAILDDNYLNKTLELTWSFKNTDYVIQVFICSDYFDAALMVNTENAGVVISPLCTPHIDSFYGLSEYLIRLRVPKYVVFSNTTISPLSEISMAGTSGIVCSTEKGETTQYKLGSAEEVLYAKLNLSSARIHKPTTIGSLLPIARRSINSIACIKGQYCLSESCLPELKQRPIINPDLFRALGKKFRIYYLTCDYYGDIVDDMSTSPSYSASVLGTVDIIVRGVNDSANKAWLYDFHKVAYRFKEKDWNYFSVNRFFKYDSVDVSSGLTAVDTLPSHDDLIKLVKLVSGIQDAKESKDVIRFMDSNWLIGDVEDCEKRRNIRAIVNIFLPDIAPTNDIAARFENEIISRYLDNRTVTGIYGGASRGLHANYVFELCCDIMELFGIVESLHANCKNENIKITTKTNLISRKFSTDLYSSLLLPSVPYEISSTIDNFIMKDLGIDMCIRLRKKSGALQANIASFYIKMNRFHGIIKKYYEAESSNLRKNKYSAVLEIIDDAKKLFCSYLINPHNIIKAASGYQNLFLLYDTCLQQILLNIRDNYFEGNDSTLLETDKLPPELKPSSPKKEITRLSFRERANLVKGFLKLDQFRELIPFTEDFFRSDQLQLMIDYRNKLIHFKPDELNEIDSPIWQEIIIWMLQVITADEATVSLIVDLVPLDSQDDSPEE